MKAVRANRFGGPEVLAWEEVPDPVAADDEVLIRVQAIGVNYSDIMRRQGIYPSGHRPPYIPGFEVAGIIEQTGENAVGFAAGDRVMTCAADGAYAELTTAPARFVMPVPDGFSNEEAAAFPAAFLTAYHVLHTCAKLDRMETVLIHAAAGGVGSAAVQLAKAIGARVFATTSSDKKYELVKLLGADEVINYAKCDFAEEVRRRNSGRGVDVVLESVGGDVLVKSLSCVEPLGRVVICGMSSGEHRPIDSLSLLFSNIGVIGFHIFKLMESRPEVVERAEKELLELVKEGQIRPVVGHTFKLTEAGKAHRLLASRESLGKLVLLP